MSKLRQYGADEKTLSLIKDCLSNRLQRVKLGGDQGSTLRPVFFNMFMSDLVYVIKNCSLSTYADDTQIFAVETEPNKLQEMINTDLAAIDRRYHANGMKRNDSKYQAMVMGNLQTLKPMFHCDNTMIPVRIS